MASGQRELDQAEKLDSILIRHLMIFQIAAQLGSRSALKFMKE